MNKESVSLSWNMPSTKQLQYFLLEITYHSKRIRVEYALINITSASLKRDEKVTFTCLNVTQDTEKVSVKLWALGSDTRMDGHTLMASGAKYATITLKPVVVSRDYIRRIQHKEGCLCRTKYNIWMEESDTGSSLTAVIRATKGELPQLAVSLLDVSEKKLERSIILDRPKVNQTSISHKFEDLPNAEYRLLINPRCSEPLGYMTSCGLIGASRVESSDTFVIRVPNREINNRQQSNNSQIIQLSTSALKNVNTPDGDDKTDMTGMIRMALIVSAFAVIALLEIAAIIKLSTFFHRAFDSRRMRSYKQLKSGGMSKSFATKSRRSAKIAIVFCPASSEHVSRIRSLQTSLKKRGHIVHIFDETSCQALRVNWIDVGEMIVKTYTDIIFVVSAALTEMCKKEPSGFDCFQLQPENNNISPIENYEYNNGCEPENRQNFLPHRLPVVVLDCLKSANAWRSKNCPYVTAVQLVERGQKGSFVVSDMQTDHPSIFKNKTLCLKFDKRHGIKINRAYTYLLHRLP
ncbi:uncharacterized protein LOC128216884 [Mya arenaria]|nr:uncharacterized protein LOC128216884 [Mya arenaria]